MEWNQILGTLIASGIISAIVSSLFAVWQNRKGEIFKTKLDIFRNFIKEEFLLSEGNLSEEKKRTIEYYWQIWLFGEIDTLKSLVYAKSGDSEPDAENINKISSVITSMRKELGADHICQEGAIQDYSKLLLQLSLENPSDKSLLDISSSLSVENKFVSLWELMSIRSWTYLKDIQHGWDFDPIYLRIRDISSFSHISLMAEHVSLPQKLQDKVIVPQKLFIISAVWTIGKTCYLHGQDDGRGFIISSSLNYWEIHSQEIDGNYLSIAFRTKFVNEQLKVITRGVAQPFVSIQGLREIKIPIISMTEQMDLIQDLKEDNINERAKKLDEMLEKH